MSETKSKCGYRVPIEFLRGKNWTEALAYFRPLIGEPEDVDEFEGEVQYFSYADNAKYRGCEEDNNGEYESKNDGWFIDMTLEEDYGYESADLHLTFGEIEKNVSELSEKFGADKSEIMVFGYSWYNGVEEPGRMK